MSTISLCMIVKNEANILERCLKSAQNFVDEIIIVDTGSTDNTKKIAKKFTNKVYDFAWCNDFSKARNYSFSLATCDYIIWLDADDVVPSNTAKKLKELKSNLCADTYLLKYNVSFVENKPTFSYYRERILKKCTNANWHGVVHECITPFGKIEKLNIAINHLKKDNSFSSRNLNIYQNLIKIRELSPREQYYYGRELFDHKKYKKCICQLRKFINSKQGWVENIIDGLYLMHLCYKKLNNNSKALDCLFETFKYDSPRANACCQIGDYFYNKKQYQTAIYWYNTATKCKDTTIKGGFIEPIYYNYYPYIQLSCCHYYMSDIKKAIMFNNRAGKFYNSQAVKQNNQFYNNTTITQQEKTQEK